MFTNSIAMEFQWGETVRTDITKSKVETIIQKYVDENYPLKVEQYQEHLKKIKQQKIEKHSEVSFVENSLMWQDNKDAATKKLNILEFKRYCKELKLANRKDWRTPQYSELLRLVDYQRISPASKQKITYIAASKYWSDSQNSDKKENFWYVNFKDGTTQEEFHLVENHIRCVRDISTLQGDY